MSKTKLDLPSDRLASVDQDGGRIPMFPAMEPGIWRSRRAVVQSILILIFLVLPWLKVRGEQILLFDLASGKFTIFGIHFWAHDGPLLFLVVAIAVLSLALCTALFGRVWCGWACPQTVFIEGVFRRIESFVEGSHLARRKLSIEPWSYRKLRIKTTKWVLFFVISLVAAHSFLAYFVGADQLLNMIMGDPRDHLSLFIISMLATAVVLFDFSFFREQFCILVCPYGRLQSVLQDQNSLAVIYDEKRGEPRKGEGQEPQGDCVNCYKCVAVCPTGVDIRRGLQMECIHCTACIDACDSVMDKVGKPKGLIRYTSEAALEGAGKLVRPRVAIYLVLLVAAIFTLVNSIHGRSGYNVTLVRAKGSTYSRISEKVISNQFKLNLQNQSNKMALLRIGLRKSEIDKKVGLIVPVNPLKVKAGEIVRTPLFVTVPDSFFLDHSLDGSLKTPEIEVLVFEQVHGEGEIEEKIVLIEKAPLLGPQRGSN